MRHFSLVTIAIALSTAAWSFIEVDPISDWVAVGAEAIWFSPNSETVSYAVLGAGGANAAVSPVQQTIIDNRLDRYHTGFRVMAACALCQRAFVAGRYTSLETRRSSTIEIPAATGSPFTESLSTLLAFRGFDGRPFNVASDHRKFIYKAADGVIGLSLLRSCPLVITAFTGVQWAQLISHDHYIYQVPLVPTLVDSQIVVGDLRQKFWGIGPLLGMHLEGQLVCGFYLSGSFATAVLIGRPVDENVTVATDFTAGLVSNTDNTIKSRPWRGVPHGDIRAGIGYCLGLFNCLSVAIEVGYEGLIYRQALQEVRNLTFFDDTSLRNVTMHGPYLSAIFTF